MFGAFAGFRSFEIADLQGERLDRVTGIYHVTGKGGREDYVPLHPVLLREARLYPSKGYWFPSPTAPRKPVDRRSVAKTITDAFERVGVSMKCHQLRHYFATALLASGVPAPVVQKLMRHASLSTTAIYMGVSIEQQREALDALDMNLIFSQFLFSDDT